MAGDLPRRLTRYLRTLLAGTQTRDASDPEPKEQFVAGRDDAALTALVRRHGPMVYHLCRRVLRNEQDAEDAFQALPGPRPQGPHAPLPGISRQLALRSSLPHGAESADGGGPAR